MWWILEVTLLMLLLVGCIMWLTPPQKSVEDTYGGEMIRKPQLFRKRPLTVEAVQWFEGETHPAVIYIGGGFYINTLEGPMHVSDGSWIVKGIKGEYYACRDDVFRLSYDPVEEEDDTPRC